MQSKPENSKDHLSVSGGEHGLAQAAEPGQLTDAQIEDLMQWPRGVMINAPFGCMTYRVREVARAAERSVLLAIDKAITATPVDGSSAPSEAAKPVASSSPDGMNALSAARDEGESA